MRGSRLARDSTMATSTESPAEITTAAAEQTTPLAMPYATGDGATASRLRESGQETFATEGLRRLQDRGLEEGQEEALEREGSGASYDSEDNGEAEPQGAEGAQHQHHQQQMVMPIQQQQQQPAQRQLSQEEQQRLIIIAQQQQILMVWYRGYREGLLIYFPDATTTAAVEGSSVVWICNGRANGDSTTDEYWAGFPYTTTATTTPNLRGGKR